jgi:hypothetical protein
MPHAYRDGELVLRERTHALERELGDLDRRRAAVSEELDRTSRQLASVVPSGARPPMTLRVSRWGRWSLFGGVVAVACVAAIRTVSNRSIGCTSQVGRAKWDTKSLLRAVEDWRADGGPRGECPRMQTLIRARVLKMDQAIEDPWGSPYEIVCSPDGDGVTSAGPDGTKETADDIWAGTKHR